MQGELITKACISPVDFAEVSGSKKTVLKDFHFSSAYWAHKEDSQGTSAQRGNPTLVSCANCGG